MWGYARPYIPCTWSGFYPYPHRRRFDCWMYVSIVIADADTYCLAVANSPSNHRNNTRSTCHNNNGDVSTCLSRSNSSGLFGECIGCHPELFIRSRINNGETRDYSDMDKPRPCLSYCHFGGTIAGIIQFTGPPSGGHIPIHFQPNRDVSVYLQHSSLHERDGDGYPVTFF